MRGGTTNVRGCVHASPLFYFRVLLALVCVTSTCHARSSWSEPTPEQLNDVWKQLDRQARKVIVERAQYVYRYDSDVLIDAFALLHWRDELDSHVQRKPKQSRRTKNGVVRVTTVGHEWSYRVDDKLKAYFSIESFPAMYWCGGVLLNEISVGSKGPSEISHHVEPYESAGSISPATAWMKNELPLIVAIDPLTQSKDSSKIYKAKEDEHGVKLSIFKGLVAGPQSRLKRLPIREDTTMMYTASVTQTYLVDPDSLDSKGLPPRSPEFFALVPSRQSTQASGGSAFRKHQHTSDRLVYRVEPLKIMRLTPKELAYAWINHEIELPYRELRRDSGEWVCTEHLLERP